MQTLREPPVWNQSAVDLLNQFLETPIGQVFLATLASQRPGFSTPTWRAEAVALRAKEIEGYEKCIQEILRLTEPVREEQSNQLPNGSSAYPPLDDDSQWDDKDKKEQK